MKAAKSRVKPCQFFRPLVTCTPCMSRGGGKTDILARFLLADYPYSAYPAGEADPAYPVPLATAYRLICRSPLCVSLFAFVSLC